jgi:signal peptidase I
VQIMRKLSAAAVLMLALNFVPLTCSSLIAFCMPSGGMEPTLRKGDGILVNIRLLGSLNSYGSQSGLK